MGARGACCEEGGGTGGLGVKTTASLQPQHAPARRAAQGQKGHSKGVHAGPASANQLASAPRAAEVAAVHDPTFAAYIPLSVPAGSLCNRQRVCNGPPSLGLDADRSQCMDPAQSQCRGHGPSKSQLFSLARGYARRVVSICMCIWLSLIHI